MRYSVIQFVGRSNQLPHETLEDDRKQFYSIPDRTESEYRFGKKESPSLKAPKNYPGISATAAWNLRKRLESRAAETKKVFQRITIRDLDTLPLPYRLQRETEILNKLKELRPSRTALLAMYLQQGLPPEVARLLVSDKNYEQLPAVKISQEQYQFLTDALDGKIDQGIVRKDFYV